MIKGITALSYTIPLCSAFHARSLIIFLLTEKIFLSIGCHVAREKRREIGRRHRKAPWQAEIVPERICRQVQKSYYDDRADIKFSFCHTYDTIITHISVMKFFGVIPKSLSYFCSSLTFSLSKKEYIHDMLSRTCAYK